MLRAVTKRLNQDPNKKTWRVLAGVTAAGLIGGAIFFYFNFSKKKIKEEDLYSKETILESCKKLKRELFVGFRALASHGNKMLAINMISTKDALNELRRGDKSGKFEIMRRLASKVEKFFTISQKFRKFGS